MGTSVVVECQHCKKRKEFYLGTGMFNFCEKQLFDLTSSANLLSYCPHKDRLKIKQLIGFNRIHLADEFGYKIYRCRQCGKYGNSFVFDLVDESGEKVYQGNQICQKCGSQDLDFDVPCEEVGCQFCGKCTKIAEVSCWD